MKKKGINIRTIIVLIAIATLAIVSVFFAVNSYFTAKSTRRGNINMAVLSLDLVNSSGTTLNSNVLTTKFPDPIEQGEKLEVDNIYVKNPTNYDLYCIIKIRLEITKQGETSPSYIKERYTNFTDKEIYVGSTDAEEITSNTSKLGISSIKVPYSLGNSYQGATAQISYKACAVQKAHIPPLENTSNTEAKYAAEFLTEEYESRDVTISLNGTTTNYNINGVTVSELTVPGVTTDNSCGWYYDEACTRPAYSTDVLTDSSTLYTKQATTDKISGTSNISATNTSITGEVIIPQTVNGTKVTSISGNAFKDCTGITSVVIPEGVTSIYESAFSGCTNLETVTIPSTCIKIGTAAFQNNTSLRTVTLNAESIQVSSSTQYHNTEYVNPFYGATNILYNEYKDVYYLGNQTNGYMLAVMAKDVSSIINCEIHSNCQSIAGKAFYSAKKLERVQLPEGLLYIGHLAFRDCDELVEINFPNTLKAIASYAFGPNHFSYLFIPASLETCTFIDAFGLTTCDRIKVDSDNVYFDSRDNCNAVIRKSTNSLELASLETVIPETVESIAAGAFRGLNIAHIVIPASVVTINGSAFNASSIQDIIIPATVLNTGRSLFSDCNSLLSIYCESSSKPAGWNESWKGTGNSATVYWYRENDPGAEEGNFWHYVDGEPVIW